MSKSKEFYFCSNKIYNSCGVYRVRWWNKHFLLSSLNYKATCVIHGVDDENEALQVAVDTFRSEGFDRQIMGSSY